MINLGLRKNLTKNIKHDLLKGWIFVPDNQPRYLEFNLLVLLSEPNLLVLFIEIKSCNSWTFEILASQWLANWLTSPSSVSQPSAHWALVQIASMQSKIDSFLIQFFLIFYLLNSFFYIKKHKLSTGYGKCK